MEFKPVSRISSRKVAGTVVIALFLSASALSQERGTANAQLVSPLMPFLTGRVVMESGARPPVFLGTLYINVSGGPNRTKFGEDGRKIRGSAASAITVARNGAFSLWLPDGEYGISLINSLGDPLSESDGYYVKSMTFGTTDIVGREFRVEGNPRPSITITLAAGKQPGK
jgi:hypothetical protein